MSQRRPIEYLERAIDQAVVSVSRSGGPFGAVLLGPEEQIAFGENRVTTTNDPTAHAEVVAIREACRLAGTFSLEGWWLYASCEPCPMCLAACLWARVDGMTFAATRFDAAAAGFDDSAFYGVFGDVSPTGLLKIEHLEHPRAREPFDAWRAFESRTPY
jgi:guanine deaminase